MNEDDTKHLLKLIRRGIKNSDWDEIVEALEFLEDISSTDDDEEL